jgi:tartrate-resistant acid phosphatase type 5
MILISRRSLLVALAVLAVTPGRSSKGAAPALNFVVVGDWGTGGSAANQRKVAVQMAKTAEAIRARFVISTGDNFPRGVQSIQDAQWVASFEEVYSSPALMVPWYITLGNHDHKGNINSQVEYTSSRWRLYASYYKHTELLADGSRADFFHIDTTPIINGGPGKDKQLDWLQSELAASGAVWKLVVGHHPICSGCGSHGNTPALVTTLKPLLERFSVQAYLNGHCHALEHIVIGQLHYLTSGAGSKLHPTKAIEGTRFTVSDRLGFMTARLTPTAMDIEFIDYEGNSLYRYRIPSVPTL